MNVDWIIAIALFLVFISWSFVYYMGFFSIEPEIMAGVEGVSKKVVGFLGVEAYEVPLVFSSGGAGSRTLWTDFSWPPDSKNSTRVFSGSETLPCYITGDRLYWRADIVAGRNEFRMRYHPSNASLYCNSGLPLSNASQVIPWVSEKGSLISRARISEMLATGFRDFSRSLGISQDFRVEIGLDNVTTGYGPEPPLGYDVYVRETPGRTEDSEPVEVRVLTWSA